MLCAIKFASGEIRMSGMLTTQPPGHSKREKGFYSKRSKFFPFRVESSFRRGLVGWLW